MMAMVRKMGPAWIAALLAILLVVAPTLVALAPVPVAAAFEAEDHEVESIKAHASADRHRFGDPSAKTPRQPAHPRRFRDSTPERCESNALVNPFSTLRLCPLRC